MQKRRALVTGGTGFLGGRLARRLHNDGWHVTAVGRNENVGAALKSEGIHFVCCDLAEVEAVISASRDQEIIFHCGARSSPWGSYKLFFRDNVLATQNVLAACKQNKVSLLIHVSTPSIYFDFQDRFNIPESQPPADPPANHYVRTKLLAEEALDTAATQGLPIITLRPRAIFGPGDVALFPRLIRANGRRGFPLIGDNDPLIDITYVENVVDALLLAVKAPTEAFGKKFNITNGEPWLRSRLLAELFTEVGIPLRSRRVSYPVAGNVAAAMELFSNIFTFGKWEPPLTRYTVAVLAKSQTLDISAARNILGYKPRVDIASGLREFGSWWRNQSHAT